MFAAALALAAILTGTPAQSTARLHGVVSDESGGVLPGVTVTVAALDGRSLAVLTTDAVGAYETEVAPGAVRVTFSLEGFSASAVDVDLREADTSVPARLSLAPRSETVVVQGKAPPPPPPLPGPTPAPPPPTIVPVEPHDRDSICGPAKPDAVPESLGIVQTLRYAGGRSLYATDDQVTIYGGTLNGLSVGQNVVARRTYRISGNAKGQVGEHTAGLLQIVEATERSAVAVVIYACDEIKRGDRLATFAPEPLRQPEPSGIAAYDNAARILFADSGQLVGAPHRFLVVDRGRSDDVHAGQRLTLFRRGRLDGVPMILGDAIVVAVRQDSATIRIDRVLDAIQPGDWAAPQRLAASGQQ